MHMNRLRSCLGTCRTFTSSTSSFSHVGSRPIPIPPATTCDILHRASPSSNPLAPSSRISRQHQIAGEQDDCTILRVQGAHGEQTLCLPSGITARLSEPTSQAKNGTGSDSPAHLLIECHAAASRNARSAWGLTRALAANAVHGVSEAFTVSVRLVGVGYRATLEPLPQPVSDRRISSKSSDATSSEQQLVLRLGFPRPVRIPLPSGVSCKIISPTDIELSGQDKQLLGQFAANVRRWRKPEPYNGKGIFVGAETVRRKEVKKK